MARKGENIYKRKDGRWEARFISSYGMDGKAKYSYVYARTYSEVKKKLSTIKSNVVSTPHNKHFEKSTFSDWSLEWAGRKKQAVKESTYIRYRNILENHVVPKLGGYPISTISTSLMNQFVQQELSSGRIDGNGGLSAKTMMDILVVIKEIFKYAQNSGVNTIVILSF